MSQVDDQPTAASDGEDPAAAGREDEAQAGGESKVYDEEYVKKLRAEAASHRTKASSLQTKLQEYEERDLTEQQKLEKRATEAEGKLTPLQHENARLKVALAKGLTGDKAILAERLRGETEEELMADAEELLKHFGGAGQRGGGFDGGARGDAAPQSMDDLIRQRAGVG